MVNCYVICKYSTSFIYVVSIHFIVEIQYDVVNSVEVLATKRRMQSWDVGPRSGHVIGFQETDEAIESRYPK